MHNLQCSFLIKMFCKWWHGFVAVDEALTMFCYVWICISFSVPLNTVHKKNTASLSAEKMHAWFHLQKRHEISNRQSYGTISSPDCLKWHRKRFTKRTNFEILCHHDIRVEIFVVRYHMTHWLISLLVPCEAYHTNQYMMMDCVFFVFYISYTIP